MVFYFIYRTKRLYETYYDSYPIISVPVISEIEIGNSKNPMQIREALLEDNSILIFYENVNGFVTLWETNIRRNNQ